MVNTYGPQTRGGGGQGEAGEHQRGQMGRDCGNAAIEERLHNIETHLKLPTGKKVTETRKFVILSGCCFNLSESVMSSQIILTLLLENLTQVQVFILNSFFFK